MTTPHTHTFMHVEYRKVVDGRVTAKYRLTAERAVTFDQLLAEAGDTANCHGNSKSVMIWGEVDREAYAARMAKYGAKPITEIFFPSAWAASLHLGYGYNAVGQALSNARKLGQDVAWIGGVPVRYAEDVKGID